MTDSFVDTQTWGAISWRKASKYDSPEVQLDGFKVMPTFVKPQFRRDVQRYVDLQSNPNDWAEPYNFLIVPFDRQEAEVETKRKALAHIESMRRPHPRQAAVDAAAAEALSGQSRIDAAYQEALDRLPGPVRVGTWGGDK